MIIYKFILILALVIFSKQQSNENFDCSDDSCFGEPQNCLPSSTCRSVLKFDVDGNVDLYLRNFTDPYAYVAFPIGKQPDETINYMICIPHAQQRLLANSELGKPVKIIEKNMARFVRRFDRNNFVCSFPSAEIGDSFRKEENFFLSTGKFVENLTIVDGQQLFGFDAESYDNSDEEENYYETISSFPISGRVSIDKELKKDVFSKDENDAANDMIQSFGEISTNEESETNLEEISAKIKQKAKARSAKSLIEDDSTETSRNPEKKRGSRLRSKTRRDDEIDEDQDKMVDKKRGKISNSKKNRKAEIQEDEEYEEYIYGDNELDTSIPRRSSQRRNIEANEELEYEDYIVEKPRRKSKNARRLSDYEEDGEHIPKMYIRRRQNVNRRKLNDDDYEEGDPRKYKDLEKKMRKQRKQTKKDNNDNSRDYYDEYDSSAQHQSITTFLITIVLIFVIV